MPANGEVQEVVLTEDSDNVSVSSFDAEDSEESYSNNVYQPSMVQQTYFRSAPDKHLHEGFFRKCIEVLLQEAVYQGTSRNNRVLEWQSPEELLRTFNFNLNEFGSSHKELIQLLKDTIRCSVKTGHPYFANQLFSSVDPYGMIGQWLTDALNPSVYTYEVSPVFTLMEEVVLREMRQIVGYENGRGDGIFCPGGSIANGYAISCARFKYQPDIKKLGLHSLPRLVVFTSEDAHYSIKKLSSFMGIGTNNVYLVQTDKMGKMSVPHLVEEIEKSLAEGAAPFLVCATAGTTVLGAYDSVQEIADVCERYNLWLHVDAAWGGGALMSRRYRYLLNGLHRADSVTWNPHKLLAAPQQCSTFLLKHERILSEVHSSNAEYLFQKDKFYNTSFDTGDKHIQCGRRADVFKFWFMWKAKGTQGLEKHVDTAFDNARYFASIARQRQGFQLVLEEPECTNVCFWYIPTSLRNAETTPDFQERLHSVAPKIKEKMMKEGSMMVTYQPQRTFPNFFRIVFQNSALDRSDMLHFVNEFERLGKDL